MTIYDAFSDEEREILRERTRRVERAVQNEAVDQQLTVLTIALREESYALPIESIMGVYEDVPITILPGTPAHIAGIANLRGHLFTVLDLAAILDVPGVAVGSSNALVVATGASYQVAMLVEKVNEVGTIMRQQINPVTSVSDNRQINYLSGLLPDGTAILNVDAILEDPVLMIDQKTQ